MPKVHNTRKQRAEKLFRMLELGPAIFDNTFGPPTKERYDNWFASWVEGELIDLIPELRKAQKDKQ